MPPKKRLDETLVERGLAPSIERAQALILAGKVRYGDSRVLKAGSSIPEGAIIEVQEEREYVSRGAYKLKGALKQFSISAQGKVCADVGSATGGFVEVLLEAGAKKVYAIDVGYGDLHWKLRQDPRVVLIERTNARHLEALPEQVELVSIDVSFISLRSILPSVKKWLAHQGEVVALVKPQFEASREEVGEGGIIQSEQLQEEIFTRIKTWSAEAEWKILGDMKSTLKGREGNQEFLLWLGI